MSHLRHPCPNCDFPLLLLREGIYEYQHGGTPVRVNGIEFCVCHRCTTETILPEQQARNRERVTTATLAVLSAKWAGTQPVVLKAGVLALVGTVSPALEAVGTFGIDDQRYPRHPDRK